MEAEKKLLEDEDQYQATVIVAEDSTYSIHEEKPAENQQDQEQR